MRTRTMWTVAATVVGTLFVLILVVLAMIYTGVYNVSATSGHTALGRGALDTMMRKSVEMRADAEVAQFTPDMIRAGAREYKAMCQHCHGGPGTSRASWAKGIVPQPPELEHAATRWEPGEVHWIVKNGIKMTAMPAFGPTHDDQAIWNITAFVEQLPTMTAQEYAAFPAGHGDGGSSESAGGHSH